MGRISSATLVRTPDSDSLQVETECLIPPHVNDVDDHVDKGWAWLIVLGSSIGQVLIITMMSSFGLLFVPLIEELDTNLEEITMAGNIMYGATYLTVTLASPVCDIVGCRVMMCTGALLLYAAFFTGYFFLDVYTFFTIGALAGIGCGLCMASSLMVIRGYFEKKRHIAFALILAANGTGSVIGPPFVTFLLNEFGLHGALLTLSGIYLHGVVGGALLRPKPVKRPQKAPHQIERADSTLLLVIKAYSVYLDKELFGSILLYLCILSSYFYLVGYMVTYSRLPNYMIKQMFSLDQASTTLLFAGAANTLGKLVGMIIIEKKAQLIIYFFICACVLSGGSLISIPLCSVALHFYAAAIGFGFFFGNIHYLANMLLIEFFGPSKLSGCFSMVYLAYTIASFTGNPLAGIVSRMTRFDGAEFFFTGSSIVVAGLVMIPSLFVTTKRSAMLKRSETLHLDTTRRSDICNYKDSTEKVEISVNILDKETAYGAISIPV